MACIIGEIRPCAKTRAVYTGSGLGLAIVQEIMARHQGRITVYSGEWGTTVRLSLPSQPSGG